MDPPSVPHLYLWVDKICLTGPIVGHSRRSRENDLREVEDPKEVERFLNLFDSLNGSHSVDTLVRGEVEEGI